MLSCDNINKPTTKRECVRFLCYWGRSYWSRCCVALRGLSDCRNVDS